jgi:aspartate aminotransferase
MPRSAIREIMALASGRPNVIHLEVGEPDFSTPRHIIDAAFEAARAGWTKYSPNAGLQTLPRAVAADSHRPPIRSSSRPARSELSIRR